MLLNRFVCVAIFFTKLFSFKSLKSLTMVSCIFTAVTQLLETLVSQNMQAFSKFQSLKGGRLLKFSVWQNLVHHHPQ